MLIVAILTLWQISRVLLNLNAHSVEELQTDFAIRFKENEIPFIYWRNVILPQLASPILIYIIYLLVNLLVFPSFKRISTDDAKGLLWKQVAKAIGSVILVSYLLAIGVNGITYLARPHLFNYSGYQFLSICGYNDSPLSNLFFGFDRALAAVVIFTGIVAFRDLIIWAIERPGLGREYRILVANTATPALLIYFLGMVIVNPDHDEFLQYVVFVTPLMALYIYLMFWLLPFKGERTFLTKPVLVRLLFVTFICILPCLFLLFSHNRPFIAILYWFFLLFIATPVIWITYQQRKDKIMQLRNMETALAKSDANLQFLKSQINPHFLFNALNTLYGTALRGDTDKTAEGIQKLGDMMRFMLHENTQDFIPMDKEIEYLKNFISLQKLRVQASDSISIEEDIEEVSGKNQIAPMLLIPFVENAFKHGISLNEKSWIKIQLRIKDNVLNFEVRNSIHFKKNKDMESGRSGIGLNNVKERLKFQYPEKHLLDIEETENEFIIKVIVKC
jgi:hypothetical protein